MYTEMYANLYKWVSKWMKENKWATIQEKNLYGTVQMNISQKRKDIIKIDYLMTF